MKRIGVSRIGRLRLPLLRHISVAAVATRISVVVPFFNRITSQPFRFTVDHPFVFMILYKSQTLFMGKVNSL